MLMLQLCMYISKCFTFIQVTTPKSCQNLWNLRTHLTGVLVHGTGSFCFFDFLQFPHDCNLTLSCILHTLEHIGKSRILPPKLFIQMDNCVRENKNKYVFGFLSLLVEKNIFTEVRKIMYSVHFNFDCYSHYNS